MIFDLFVLDQKLREESVEPPISSSIQIPIEALFLASRCIGYV